MIENSRVLCDKCHRVIVPNMMEDIFHNVVEYSKTDGVILCEECKSKTIDNFDKVSKDLMKFDNQNQFYFVQIIQRKKDGNITHIGNNGFRLIKSYDIFSVDQLMRSRQKIQELCINNNARAYLNVNIRDAQEVALSCISGLAQLVSEGNAYQGYRIWDSSCGKTRSSKRRPLWVVDVDTKDLETLEVIKSLMKQCRSSYTPETLIESILPTVHGYHVISHGFDVQQFQQLLQLHQLDTLDIQKDNPTLLFYSAR